MSCELDVESELPAEDIRAACARVVASPAFRASPQLTSFLRFVVDATLAGQSERLKGYTIAIEALGRDEDFDPQSDPIVRVEAGRLRRALERYYSETGADDPVEIELPRGSYVPVFHRRIQPATPNRKLVDQVSEAGTLVLARLRRHAAPIGFLLLGALIYDFADLLFDFNNRSGAAVTASSADGAASPRRRFQSVGPMIYVEPFAFLGASTDWNIPLTRVREKLADALSRFDEINVVSDLGPGPATGTSAIAQAAISPQRVETKTASDDAFVPRIDYRLAASAESPDEGVITLMFRLIDTEDGTIVWSKNFERIALGADPREPENAVIRELATILGQPFGIVHTHERMKLPANSNIDPRYACLLATFDYWRDYDVRRHAGVRSCLRQAIEMDPTFALGFAALARVYFREYQFGIADDETPPPPLDRALTAARRAITLKPNSVRAHRVLADIYLARGEVPAALAAGDKALALNPYDLGTLVHVGTQLAALGELDRARTMLRQAAFFGLVRPVRIDFGLFLLAYLSGDFDEARTLASELPRDKFALGYLARALICVKNGDDAGAQRAIAKLVNLQPGIRNDLRGELGKFFPGPPVVDRLARDLTKAGLLASN